MAETNFEQSSDGQAGSKTADCGEPDQGASKGNSAELPDGGEPYQPAWEDRSHDEKDDESNDGKEDDSDFQPDDREMEANGTEPSDGGDSPWQGGTGSDDDDDDGSDGSSGASWRGRRRRRRQQQQRQRPKRKRPTPPETEMRRKLRPREAEASDGSADEGSDGPSQGEDGAADEPEAAEAEVPLRERSEEEIAAEMAELKSMWEMAAVLDFLHIFRREVNAKAAFTAEELERDLVVSDGRQGLLADLHTAVISGFTTPSALGSAGWQKLVAKEVSAHWDVVGDGGPAPLRAGKGEDPVADYAAMPTAKRAIVLKALCDIRLNCGDIMQRIEEAVNVTKMNPKKREALLKGQGRKGAALVEVLDDFRRQPLGTDSSGRVYWWLDFWETTGSRLYRHTPGTRRKKALDASPGSWEFLGSTPDDLQNVSQELVRSRKKPDRQLVSAIDTVVVEMSERIEAEERRRRARARLRLDVGVILDNGESRSRRARRDVKYTFDDFDEMIGAALREGRRSRNQSQPGRERREASPIKYDIGSRSSARLRGKNGNNAGVSEGAAEAGDDPNGRGEALGSGSSVSGSGGEPELASEPEEHGEGEGSGLGGHGRASPNAHTVSDSAAGGGGHRGSPVSLAAAAPLNGGTDGRRSDAEPSSPAKEPSNRSLEGAGMEPSHAADWPEQLAA
uniref:Ddt domain-containing protein n=1 Tax=Tetraselmis sp. GSL018 TaxID=582737 RepID=A0A061QXF9_9CHLO|mmetsp:Transcript_31545/g.74976  ORF Transcript_31545/g.74976 Transcript_31545/m.74976 type:complete len:678 (-) Transcript_31545:140-2173(-)